VSQRVRLWPLAVGDGSPESASAEANAVIAVHVGKV
jgi:hypothetical protein